MSTYFATSISVLSQIAVKAYDNSNAFKSNKGFSTPLGSVNLLSSQEVTPQLPNGFTLIAQGYDSKTNYYGIAMRNNATGEVVFAHRGTEGNVKDIQMDQAIANSKVPDSATAALNFVQKTIKENHLENSTIINVGHSKGAYEANYVNAKLSDSVMAGGDRSKFAAFGLDTPALDPVAAKLTQAVGSYQSLNIVATTDPVNQLTRAYGLVVPGQTVYVKVPGTGAADDITGMGEGCRKTAAALSASSSNLYVEGLAWGVAKLYDGDPRFPGSNTTTIGRLFAACNLDVTGHSSVALSNQLSKTISGMTLSGGMSDPTLRGNASNTVIGDVGWGTTEFRELAKRMINVYIGKGHGFGNAEGQINQQAIEATVSQAFAGVDMTGAKAFDMDGMLYVRLPSGKTLWVTPEGKLGSEQIQTRADGSTTIETHQTDGTVRQATLDAKGNYSAITTDAQGRLLGKVTAMIDGTRQVDINNPDTGERYTAKTTATGSTMTGVDASGKAVSASSSTRWDEVQGMYVTTSQNIDGSQTLAYSNKDGLLLQSTNSVKNADQTVTQTTTMNDGRGETLNYSASGQFLGGEVRYTNGFGVDVTERYGADKKLLSRTEVQTYDDGSRFEYKTEAGKNYIQAIDEDGKASGWKEYKTPAQEQATNAMYSDMAGFVNALRGKDKVNQLLYAAKIGINYQISQGNTNPSLQSLNKDVAALGAVVGVVAGLRAMRSGDTNTQIGGAVGLVSSANMLYSYASTGSVSGAGFLTAAEAGALQLVGAALSIANLEHLDEMIDNGQYGSAMATLYGAYVGVTAIGSYIAGATLSSLVTSAAAAGPVGVLVAMGAIALDSMFAEDPPPPPPFGDATFRRDAKGQLVWDYGSQSNDLGRSVLAPHMQAMAAKLKTYVDESNKGVTDTDRQFVLLASRLPKVYIQSWPSHTDNGKTNFFFALEYKHPQTGEKIYATVARDDLDSDYAAYTVMPEALVQRWQAATMSGRFGADESQWLTEGQWANANSALGQQRAKLSAAVQAAQAALNDAKQTHLKLVGTQVVTDGAVGAGVAQAEQKLKSALAALQVFTAEHPQNGDTAARIVDSTLVANMQILKASDPEEYLKAYNLARDKTSQQWMKVIALDWDGDGKVAHLAALQNAGTDLKSLQSDGAARFDVDGDGYREVTEWINPSDAMLGIDLDGDGVIGNSREMFNGAATAFDQRGWGSLKYYDSNKDNKIDRSDAVFKLLGLHAANDINFRRAA